METLAAPLQASTHRSEMSRSGFVCRRMVESDLEPAVELLAAGFPERGTRYWRRALDRLRLRSVPAERPRYGYVLADGDRLVGIILLLFAEADDGTCRANVSSWYVEPAYRSFSHLLLAQALKLRDVTLFNISPALNTIETVIAQGFAFYVQGTAFVLAALGARVPGAWVRRVDASTVDANGMLLDHALWGCICFEVIENGARHPFIFVPTYFLRNRVPCAQLVYCPDVEIFRRYAGPLGRRLLALGFPVLALDAPSRLAGLPGLYRKRRGRRIFRGASSPRIGDLAYSELPMFGP